MTSSKNTKRALLASILSVVLCTAMLIGSTFAWFTDSVTNTGNRIVAGNLKVDLVMDKTGNGNYESIANSEGDIFNEANVVQNSNKTLWEPGKTQIVYLGVQNKGNLALKYNILLNVRDNGLVGALEYAVLDGKKAEDFATVTNWEDLTAMADEQTGDIKAGTMTVAPNGCLDEIVNGEENETDYFALAVHMKDKAGNEFQNKDITIDVAVVATQAAAEEDSFGNQYDENAEYDLNNVYIGSTQYDSINAAVEAAENGDTIRLSAGTFHEAVNLQGKSVTLQGAGKGLTVIAGPEDYSSIPEITVTGNAFCMGAYADNNDRGIVTVQSDSTVVLENLTVQGKSESLTNELLWNDYHEFAGILIYDSNVTLNNVEVTGINNDTARKGENGSVRHGTGVLATGSLDGLKNDKEYTLTVNGGSFSDNVDSSFLLMNYNYKVNILGAEIVGGANSKQTSWHFGIRSAAAYLNVKGCTFRGFDANSCGNTTGALSSAWVNGGNADTFEADNTFENYSAAGWLDYGGLGALRHNEYASQYPHA